jgi:N-formylglutamate amidohydrolase
MMQPGWVLTEGDGPVVAVALHDGHEVRPEVAALLAVTETDRWREEDPFTATWSEIGNIRIVAKRSRFEVDLNRPKEKAVYLKPEEAWGLRVWRTHPPSDIIAHALADYKAFYTTIGRVFSDLTCRFGRFVV